MKCEAETPPFSDFLGTLCLGLAVCLECSEGGIRQGSGYAGLRLREDFGINYVQGNPWSALTEESTISGCAENGGGGRGGGGGEGGGCGRVSEEAAGVSR